MRSITRIELALVSRCCWSGRSPCCNWQTSSNCRSVQHHNTAASCKSGDHPNRAGHVTQVAQQRCRDGSDSVIMSDSLQDRWCAE